MVKYDPLNKIICSLCCFLKERSPGHAQKGSKACLLCFYTNFTWRKKRIIQTYKIRALSWSEIDMNKTQQTCFRSFWACSVWTLPYHKNICCLKVKRTQASHHNVSHRCVFYPVFFWKHSVPGDRYRYSNQPKWTVSPKKIAFIHVRGHYYFFGW